MQIAPSLFLFLLLLLLCSSLLLLLLLLPIHDRISAALLSVSDPLSLLRNVLRGALVWKGGEGEREEETITIFFSRKIAVLDWLQELQRLIKGLFWCSALLKVCVRACLS